MKKINSLHLVFIVSVLAVGCSSNVTKDGELAERVLLEPSFLEKSTEPDRPVSSSLAFPMGEGGTKPASAASNSNSIDSLNWEPPKIVNSDLLRDKFPDNDQLFLNADNMSVKDFSHYVFGELLDMSFILDASVNERDDQASDPITINLARPLSSRGLFDLASRILMDRDVHLKFSDDVFLIFRPKDLLTDQQIVLGFGRKKTDIPRSAKKIMQVIPLRFGIKITLEQTLKKLTNARITPIFDQSTLYVEGSREDIVKAIELIDLLDTPAARGRFIGLLELTYVSPKDFAEEVALLLDMEGIDVSVGNAMKKNLVLIPLDQRGAVVMFATERLFIDRVRYWAALNDVPGEGNNKQYFAYAPSNARASDLGKSVSQLLGGAAAGNGSGNDSESSTGNAPSRSRSSGVNTDDLSMVVDERSNLVLFYTTGVRYQNIMPLLRRLDTLPKQVVLDITIAEVTLKDEFKHGVEWAYSRGEVSLTTNGAFGASGVGGIGMVVAGNSGPVTANALITNNLVKVLSKPTITVRDGVSASITVGSQISVIGETTQDPINGERQTTTSSYRSTGVDVSVLPTINSESVISLVVSQSITNSVPGSSGAGGNPDITERSISTEVITRTGKTTMLAGLISETSSSGGSGAPGLSKIPLLGHLFKAEANSKDRTELIMLITPRIVEDLSSWGLVKQDFEDSLRFLKLE